MRTQENNNTEDDIFTEEEIGDGLLTIMVPADVDKRVDAWLSEQFPVFSRSRFQMLIRGRYVTCDGAFIKPSTLPRVGQLIEITFPPPIPAIPEPEDIPLDVVFEDEHCLVVNKPAGLVVHPAAGHPTGTLVNALLHYCHDLTGIGGVERPGIVHRLDKDTSGLIIVAKNDPAMAAFVELFQARSISKLYWALVHGCPEPPEGRIENQLARKPRQRRKMAVVETSGRTAITNYRVEKTFEATRTSLLRCQIETGRTHQIRVHMRSIGCPILGDIAYGRSSADRALPVVPRRQMLHAAQLRFTHPLTGQPVHLESPLPEDFATVLASLE